MTHPLSTKRTERTTAHPAPFLVVANVERALLRPIREALATLEAPLVTVFPVTTWAKGRELVYRAARCRIDDVLFRVEVVCGEEQVRFVVGAIRGVLEKEEGAAGAAGSVVAMALSPA